MPTMTSGSAAITGPPGERSPRRIPHPPPSLHAYHPVHFDDLIRVGREHDGGYVLPADVIDRSAALLSLGVNDDWSFEEGVHGRNPGIRVVCVDGNASLSRIVLKAMRKALEMIGALLTGQKDKLVRNARYLSRPLPFWRFFARHELLRLMVAETAGSRRITLPDLMDRVSPPGAEHWTILKSDIEGSEYAVLASAGDWMRRVSALVIEFHGLDRNWQQFVSCLDRLLREFHIAHVHGNNFDGMIPGTSVPVTVEVTLVNRAFAPGPRSLTPGPYPLAGLDMPNNRKLPDLPISFRDEDGVTVRTQP
jgi:hypothetical protein